MSAGCCPLLFHMVKEDRDPHGFSACYETYCELWNEEKKKCSLWLLANKLNEEASDDSET